jgi:Tfp pilus assembly protein PilX
MHMNRCRTRLAGEEGTALVIALMAVLLLTALGAAVVMVTNTETSISANYKNSTEALYAAAAAVERVVQDLLMVPRWNDILGGTAQSAFVDGTMA